MPHDTCVYQAAGVPLLLPTIQQVTQAHIHGNNVYTGSAHHLYPAGIALHRPHCGGVDLADARDAPWLAIHRPNCIGDGLVVEVVGHLPGCEACLHSELQCQLHVSVI